MKFLLVVILISISCIATDGEMYSERYDRMDVDEVLQNKRLLIAYIKCILDEGKCTMEGKELKGHIADALQTGCHKCSEKQRKNIKKVVGHMMKHEPEYWNQIVEKYDSEGVYSNKYEKELKSID